MSEKEEVCLIAKGRSFRLPINKEFCNGEIEIQLLDNNCAICHLVKLDGKTNNIYAMAKEFLKQYEVTKVSSAGAITLKYIEHCSKTFDLIEEYCRSEYSKFGKIIMEDEFEEINAELKKYAP